MKKNLFILMTCCALTISAFAQKPKTKSPAGVTRTAPANVEKAKVTVRKMNGDRLSGLFVGATGGVVTIEISGTPVKFPVDEIAAITFGDAAAAAPTVQPTAATSLSFEAAVIYQSGGITPVARTDFYLLDKSLEAILTESGAAPENGLDIISSLGFAIKYPSQHSAFGAAAFPAVKNHTKYSLTSDFGGKGEFSNIETGDYWLYGMSTTRKGFVIWNVPVKINAGANSVTLDQNNAAVAF